MKTVVLGTRPPELEALIEQRQTLGQDRYDEVWEGEYHMAPAPSFAHSHVDQQLAELLGPLASAAGLSASGPFNLGGPDDFRVPDRGLHRGRPTGVWLPTAAVVVEIVSPDDETWAKLGFYAAHGVDELVIADPGARSIAWLEPGDTGYAEVEGSRLLGVSSQGLAEEIDWPELP